MEINGKAILVGILSGIGILALFMTVLTIFQSYGFALYEFKRLWLWLVLLAIGFGTQIGLYVSLCCSSVIKPGIITSGTISGGSMLLCCTHYLLNILPFIGLTGASAFSSFLMEYQKAFFSIGILSSLIGIGMLLYYKYKLKGSIS